MPGQQMRGSSTGVPLLRLQAKAGQMLLPQWKAPG